MFLTLDWVPSTMFLERHYKSANRMIIISQSCPPGRFPFRPSTCKNLFSSNFHFFAQNELFLANFHFFTFASERLSLANFCLKLHLVIKKGFFFFKISVFAGGAVRAVKSQPRKMEQEQRREEKREEGDNLTTQLSKHTNQKKPTVPPTNQPYCWIPWPARQEKSNLASFNSFFARFVTQGFSAASCLDIDALSSAVRPKCQHQAVCPVIEAIKPVKPVFSSRNFPEKHTEFRLTILTLNVRLAPFTTVPLSPFYLILEKQTK